MRRDLGRSFRATADNVLLGRVGFGKCALVQQAIGMNAEFSPRSRGRALFPRVFSQISCVMSLSSTSRSRERLGRRSRGRRRNAHFRKHGDAYFRKRRPLKLSSPPKPRILAYKDAASLAFIAGYPKSRLPEIPKVLSSRPLSLILNVVFANLKAIPAKSQ